MNILRSFVAVFALAGAGISSVNSVSDTHAVQQYAQYVQQTNQTANHTVANIFAGE